MNGTIEFWAPFSPEALGLILGAALVFIVYGIVKLVVSLVTGTS